MRKVRVTLKSLKKKDNQTDAAELLDEASNNDSDELYEFEATDADGEPIILQIGNDVLGAILEQVADKLKRS